MPRVTEARVAAVSPRLLDLVPSFQRHLKAERKAPRTVASYTEAVRRLHDFLTARGMPQEVASITSEHIEAFMEDQQARLRPSSARVRYASLVQFFKWVVEDGERIDSPMPRLDLVVPEQPVPVLRLEELRALLRTVERDSGFFGRRDAAVVRLFVDTGCRLSELADLELDSIDLEQESVTFAGKGGRDRTNHIGTKTVRSLDKYLRVRGGHRDAGQPYLWLGRSGRFTSYGVAEMVKRRAREAGIGNIHVHQLRHSAAHYLRVGGADDDAVLRLMGWKDRSMLHRYGASAADERAREVHRRVGLGDRL
jgi:site-specific recombinase XerD